MCVVFFHAGALSGDLVASAHKGPQGASDEADRAAGLAWTVYAKLKGFDDRQHHDRNQQ